MKIKYLQDIPLSYELLTYTQLLEETVDGVFKADGYQVAAVLHNSRLYYACFNSGSLDTLHEITQTLSKLNWIEYEFRRMENPPSYTFSTVGVRDVNDPRRLTNIFP